LTGFSKSQRLKLVPKPCALAHSQLVLEQAQLRIRQYTFASSRLLKDTDIFCCTFIIFKSRFA
jgi:hypothetical protein